MQNLLDFFFKHFPKECIEKDAYYFLAVSGGMDSTFLTYIFAKLLQEQYISRVIVLHIDHNLRMESSKDADFVQEQAKKLGLPYLSASVNVRKYAEENKMNIEEAARILRYQNLQRLMKDYLKKLATTKVSKADAMSGNNLLKDCSALYEESLLILAHHSNDYLESVLLALMRGSSHSAFHTLKMRTQLFGIATFRPLLSMKRSMIEEMVAELQIPYVEDSSNQDMNFKRNRLRQQIIPILIKEGLDPLYLWQSFQGFMEMKAESIQKKEHSFVRLDRKLFYENISLAELKNILDIALKSLYSFQIKRSSIEHMSEKMRQAKKSFAFSWFSNDYCIWSTPTSPIWIWLKNAPFYEPYRITEEKAIPHSHKKDTQRDLSHQENKHPKTTAVCVLYNDKKQWVYLANNEEIASFENGMFVMESKKDLTPQQKQIHSKKKLKKKLQEYEAFPAVIRKKLPLVRVRNSLQVTRICTSFLGLTWKDIYFSR